MKCERGKGSAKVLGLAPFHTAEKKLKFFEKEPFGGFFLNRLDGYFSMAVYKKKEKEGRDGVKGI